MGARSVPDRLTVAIDARLVSSQNTGDTSYWRGLLFGLSQLEVETRFLLMSNVERPAGVPGGDRFEWVVVPGGGRMWSLWSFPKAAERMGADVVHGQYNLSPLIGRKGVSTVHDVSFFIGPEWFKLKDRVLLQNQVPATMRRSGGVITVSETSRREILKFVPGVEGKVWVTYNALSPDFEVIDREVARGILRAELGIEEDFVLTIGTRWPRKNMELAVRAVGALGDRVGHRLMVAGHAGWGEIPENDRTQYLGYVSDRHLSALYAAADLYLAPSFHEGFGIPLLEAWASGCPVLCSGGGALPEVAGDAAVVAGDFLVETWAGLMGDLLLDSSKLEELRAAGRDRLAKFSWVDTARATHEVYQNVAKSVS